MIVIDLSWFIENWAIIIGPLYVLGGMCSVYFASRLLPGVYRDDIDGNEDWGRLLTTNEWRLLARYFSFFFWPLTPVVLVIVAVLVGAVVLLREGTRYLNRLLKKLSN